MDAGDEICNVISQRLFNSYNARTLLSFLLKAKKSSNSGSDKDYANASKSKSADGKEQYQIDMSDDPSKANLVIDHNLEAQNKGFMQEINSNFDYSALKAYVLNNDFNIPCTQVDESIIFSVNDHEKYQQIKEQVDQNILNLAKDENKVHDIVTQAKIDCNSIEEGLYQNLPYSHDRDIVEKVAKNTDALTEKEFKEDCKRETFEKMKDDILGKEEITLSKGSINKDIEKLKNKDDVIKQYGTVDVKWNKNNMEEPNKTTINKVLQSVEKIKPNDKVAALEFTKNKDNIKVKVLNSNNKKLMDLNVKRNPNFKQKTSKKSSKALTNKTRAIRRIKKSSSRPTITPQKEIVRKTITNTVKIPNVKVPGL